ncbi:hypothetical protein TVAG_244560 [Trichomonas vaginalis G3]|uniref:Uncharacterized protein n=1 Tax=Trichomonas vaginalis (strain ATCC PRA-98 / G3) TaxID=412133 RepID=A2ES43_TRIV3|nr:hypothetical protein TVAGG3_0690040 [Trichomonas vaginalis G3]EAY04555.1 hypothetical protein TVAG_244560 [Trichomonas vaginalis G3]KAI5508503.1 hypothetical protein TVAGG3_0690040 [Trichomonas vaginalis G3]|eukprot:XP_001316778.1 hypothetical protein [Trichomonas vaginalis G3]
MISLWIISIDNPFQECTVSIPVILAKYQFQTIEIPAGQCLATNADAMIATYSDEERYKLSYKTTTFENGQVKFSDEIQFEVENPLFLNHIDSQKYYKISAVNTSKTINLFFMLIDGTGNDGSIHETYIVNIAKGDFQIVSNKDKKIYIGVIYKNALEHLTISSNNSIKVLYKDKEESGTFQMYQEQGPFVLEITASGPTLTKVDHYGTYNGIFDANQFQVYEGIVPAINGPISSTDAWIAESKRNRAIQYEIDESYNGECNYSYTEKDSIIKTFNLKANECLRTTVPVILSANKNYSVKGQTRDSQGTWTSDFTAASPLFLNVNDGGRVYSKITCDDCKIQISQIIPSTKITNLFVDTVIKGLYNGQASKTAKGYSFISLKPLTITIESELGAYFARPTDEESTLIKGQKIIKTQGSDLFQLYNSGFDSKFTITLSGGRSSTEDEEFLFPDYSGEVPSNNGPIKITGVNSVKESPKGSNGGSSVWIPIVVAIVVILVIAGIVVGLVLFFINRKKKEAENAQDSPDTKENNPAQP